MQFSEAAQWADIAFLLAGFAAQGRRSRRMLESLEILAECTRKIVLRLYAKEKS